MRRLAIALLCALAVAGCGHSNTAEPGAEDKIYSGDVVLWATAPDGTVLWAAEGRDGRTVYFSSSGVQSSHAEGCGKNCAHEVPDYVPAMQWPGDPLEGATQ